MHFSEIIKLQFRKKAPYMLRYFTLYELETFGTRKRILRKNWRDVAVPESVQSCFELSSSSRLVRYIQTNVWEVEKTTGRFLAQLHPSNFFLKSFS